MFKLLFLAIVGLALGNAPSSNVTTLDDGNFQDYITNHSVVFVDFYAPWCEKCKEIDETIEEAANIVKDWKLPCEVAKLDATKNQITAKKYSVSSFPTLKVFVQGLPLDYTKDIAPEKIAEFVKLKAMVPVIELTTKIQGESIMRGKGRRVIFFHSSCSRYW